MDKQNKVPSFGFLSWLAGFFDGEGSISASKGGMTKLQIAQSGDIGRQVLSEIEQVMGVGILGVDCKNHRLPAWRWMVFRKEDVQWVLNLLLPFLKVKHAKAQQVLGYLNDVRGRLSRRETNFIQDNCRNLSIGEISKELDRSPGTILFFLKKHRLPRYRRKIASSPLYTVRAWEKTEENILIEEYLNKTSAELGVMLNRSPHSVRARARVLGIATKSHSWRWHRK